MATSLARPITHRRGWRGLWLGVCLGTLLLGAHPAHGHGEPFTTAQERLLSLEAETPAFRHFAGLFLHDFLRDAGLQHPGDGRVPRDVWSEAVAEAPGLRALAVALASEAEALSAGLVLAPGIEPDADMLYRFSAWELKRFFEAWIIVLDEIEETKAPPAVSSWDFGMHLDRANDGYDMARLYRILANQAYVFERSGLMDAVRQDALE